MDDRPEYPAGIPQREPTHPGEVWNEILREHLRLPIAEAARRMGIARQVLYRVLNREAPVTIDVALRFARLVGTEPSLYIAMQSARDLWFAERRLHDTLEGIEPAVAA